ncbi:MAG: aspartyl protease family protein, partial [Saprospiraceae bacterium]|nr:aspartyl protease family protein [Saprospiraceae bacterium]
MNGKAQIGFNLGPHGNTVLNFESTNHFIIMEVKFGNVLPLKFIFDTGSEHTLLFKKEYADLLGIQYDRKIPLMGSDMSQEIYGYITRRVSLIISDNYKVTTDILVLEDDYLKLEESTGVKIDGIIGANIFKFFVLEVNNKKNKIKLQEANRFKPPKKLDEVSVEIYRNKPYVDGSMTVGGDSLEVK